MPSPQLFGVPIANLLGGLCAVWFVNSIRLAWHQGVSLVKTDLQCLWYSECRSIRLHWAGPAASSHGIPRLRPKQRGCWLCVCWLLVAELVCTCVSAWLRMLRPKLDIDLNPDHPSPETWTSVRQDKWTNGSGSRQMCSLWSCYPTVAVDPNGPF